MPFASEKFSFGAAPKCGCTWVLSGLAEAGVELERKAGTKVHLPGKVNGLPAITVVRPPVDWLRSYYQNMEFRRCQNRVVDDLQALDFRSLRAFFEGYLQKFPGKITHEIFPSYEADYTIQLIDLSTGLVSVLDILEVEFNELILSSKPPLNKTAEKVLVPPDLVTAVEEAESQ